MNHDSWACACDRLPHSFGVGIVDVGLERGHGRGAWALGVSVKRGCRAWVSGLGIGRGGVLGVGEHAGIG